MKRKPITIIILIITIFLCNIYYNITSAYYTANNYSVTLWVDEAFLLCSPGETVFVDVRLENKCRRIISSDNGIFLSYHLLDVNGGGLEFDNQRSVIHPINPFGTGKDAVGVAAPLEEGEYIVEIDLVEENVAWFSLKGNDALRISLFVKSGI